MNPFDEPLGKDNFISEPKQIIESKIEYSILPKISNIHHTGDSVEIILSIEQNEFMTLKLNKSELEKLNTYYINNFTQ